MKHPLSSCWEVNVQNELNIVPYSSSDYLMPTFEIFTDQSFSFSLRVYGWMLSDDHELYVTYNRSFLNVTLSKFLTHLILCDGITTPDPEKKLNSQKYIIPKMFSYFEYQQLSYKRRSHEDECLHSNACHFLLYRRKNVIRKTERVLF